MLLRNRLEALGPAIVEICRISGSPGMSLGVLHHGELVHQANFGYRDVEAQLPPDENTAFLIGSLTKVITASIAGILVEEGKLDWSTLLRDVIPEFQRHDHDPAVNITLTDLLGHRTGLPSYDSLWLLSNNNVALNRSQAVPILSYVPTAAPLRTEFIYSNMGYEVIGRMIEKISNAEYANILQERILDPLGMNRTFYTNAPGNLENSAKAYAPLEDGTPVEIPRPLRQKDSLIGAAGGIRSSVKDLLSFYKVYMEATNFQFKEGGSVLPDPKNPLKQLPELLRGMISMPFTSLREYSYAGGWVRAQLPAFLGLQMQDPDPSENGMLGYGLPSRLALIHQGIIPGATSYAALFPETSSAVVILTNSLPLADTARIVGSLIVETLFGNNVTSDHYIEFTRGSASEGASTMAEVRKELLSERTVLQPAHALDSYLGRYYNSIGNFFIDIIQKDENLQVSYMGLKDDTYDLHPFQHDSFFWTLTHNECARRARDTAYLPSYYVLKFGCEEGGGYLNEDIDMGCLKWHHEAMLPGDGEIFRKQKPNAGYAYWHGWRRMAQNVLSKF